MNDISLYSLQTEFAKYAATASYALAASGAAVPSLQQVTDIGATTTNSVTVATMSISNLNYASERILTTSGSAQLKGDLQTDSQFVTNAVIISALLNETYWTGSNYSGTTIGLVEGQEYFGPVYRYSYANSTVTRYPHYPWVPYVSGAYATLLTASIETLTSSLANIGTASFNTTTTIYSTESYTKIGTASIYEATHSKAKFGTSADYSQFELDGTLVMYGSASVWNDIVIPIANLRTGVTPPSFAAITGSIYMIRFDDATTDIVYGSFELLHDYKEGSDIEMHLHWFPETSAAGDVIFTLEYSYAGMSTGILTGPQTLIVTASGPFTASKHVYTRLGYISGSTMKIGEAVIFALSRLGTETADSYTGNAFMHTIGCHYEIDTIGSRQMAVK